MDDFTSIGSPQGQRLQREENIPEFLSPEPDDFIPDSLTAFINAAKATLQDAQLSLQGQFDSPSKASTRGDEDDWKTPNHLDMHEDEDDRKLRQEVMYKFNGEHLFSPQSEVTTSPAVMSQPDETSSSLATATTVKSYRPDKFMTPGLNDFEEGREDSFFMEDEFSLALESLDEPECVLDPSVMSRDEGRGSLESVEYPIVETPLVVQSFGSMTLLAKSSTQAINYNSAALTTSQSASYAQVQFDTPSCTAFYASGPKSTLLSGTTSPEIPTSVSIQNPPSPQLAESVFTATTEFEKSPNRSEKGITPPPISGRQVVPVPDQSLFKLSLVSASTPKLSVESRAKVGVNSTSYNGSDPRGSPFPNVAPVVSFPLELSSLEKSPLDLSAKSRSQIESSSDLNTRDSISVQQSKESVELTKAVIEKIYTELLPRDIDSPIELATAIRKVVVIAACDSTLKMPSRREDVNGSRETAPREDSVYLPSSIEVRYPATSEHDDIFLPNKIPAVEISARRSKESLDRKPTGRSIIERFAGSTKTNRETPSKKTATKISGRTSYSPTTKKPSNITLPPKLPKRESSTRYRTNSPTRLVRIGQLSLPSKETVPFNPDDGVAKARARIKKRQLLEKQHLRQVEDSARKQGIITKVTSRNKVVSANDRRTRERVRQQHLEANTKQHGAYSHRLVSSERVEGVTIVPTRTNLVTKSFRGSTSPSKVGRQERASSESTSISRAAIFCNNADRPRSVTTDKSSRPLLTIPKGPRLSTAAKYGDKPTPSSQETLKRPMIQKPIRSMSAPNKSLTVRKHPTLLTRANYGDKTTSTVREEKQIEPRIIIASTNITSGRPRLTTPVPFKFHESKTIPFPEQTKKDELSLAESMCYFMEKGLRQDTPIMNANREMTLTIPKSPKFTPILKRAVPKSTAEKEKEVMDYYEAHPFKASKVRMSLTSSNGQTVIPTAKKRKVTIPEPFQLKSDDRAKLSNPALIPTDAYRSLSDLEECKKQFQARRLPDLSLRSPLKTDTSQPKVVTTPEPFRLASEGKKPKALCAPTEDEKEMEKQFRALPLPRSTFVSPPQRRIGNGIPSTIVTSEHLTFQPPKLATSARTEKRVASKEASRQNAEFVLKQRERTRLRKQHEKHLEEIASATLYSPTTPTDPEPFRLSSLIRHENFQRQLEEQRQQELELEKRRRSFLARPVRVTPPPQKIKSQKPLTQPEPFRLNTVSRHEDFEKDRRSKEEATQKENTRLATPKARPLPNFQTYKPITPKVVKKLVEPFSPELASKRRAQQRKEFDEKVERIRQVEAARKKTIMDQEAADQEAEMQERRRLPVQDGGLMHKAKPINAGLENFQ